MDFETKYENVALLIRYAAQLFYEEKGKPQNGQKLIKIANQLKQYAYPINLIKKKINQNILN